MQGSARSIQVYKAKAYYSLSCRVDWKVYSIEARAAGKCDAW